MTIDQDFVYSKGMNTQTISYSIPIFNINSSPNEANQILEVVDIILQYKIHSKRILLAVSELRKQNIILEYNWLWDHNPKIDWKTREVQISQCSI